MNIALFVETYTGFINGVKTHVETLKKGLESLGHNVLIVCALPGAKKHFIKNSVLYCPSIKIKKIYNYGIAKPISRTRFKYIKNFTPDIIHIHTEFGIGFSGVSAAKILKIPYVYTMHTMYDDYIYYIAPKKLINITKKTAHLYVKFFAKNATAIIGPSSKVEDFLKSCGLSKPVEIIPNSVELSIFDYNIVTEQKKNDLRERLNIKKGDLVGCFCGRLGKEKNLDVLLKYWSDILKESNIYKLLIFGDGPFRSYFENIAKKFGIYSNVIFLGKINHENLAPYYCICDFYVTASLSEVHSISTLEAMSCGLPVFHIYDELNKNQIIEGVNGFIYKDVFEMKRLIFRYKDMNDDEKMKLKISTRNSILNFGEINLAKKVLDVYEKAFKIYSEKK